MQHQGLPRGCACSLLGTNIRRKKTEKKEKKLAEAAAMVFGHAYFRFDFHGSMAPRVPQPRTYEPTTEEINAT
jgi:hypothetical protein